MNTRIPTDFACNRWDEDQRRHIVAETLTGFIVLFFGMLWLFWLAGGA